MYIKVRYVAVSYTHLDVYKRQKCSYVEQTIDGKTKSIMVYKDPKTDSGMKKSHKGCCAVFYNHVTGEFDCDEGMTLKEAHNEPFNLRHGVPFQGRAFRRMRAGEYPACGDRIQFRAGKSAVGIPCR